MVAELNEPVLSGEDRRLWETWCRTAALHARTSPFKRRVEQALRAVERAFEATDDWCLAWSAGKDSTVLLHLVRVLAGRDVPVYSEKDDLDFPGEEDYVRRLAEQWDVRLTVVRPSVSLRRWVAENAERLGLRADEDFHGRAAALSKEHFYDLIERHTKRHAGTFLGLRAGESAGRKANRRVRGLVYRRSDGHYIGTPLGDWSGMDVLAYAVSNDIELLPVYQCIALAHRNEPWHLRKSWWIPGSHAAMGGVAWLARYYPSLFRELCEILPDARRMR